MVSPRRSLVPAAVLSGLLSVFGAPTATADHDDEIYCGIHHRHYGPRHFHSHPSGYVVLSSGNYHFYPEPAYGSLAAEWYGRPALYVSGGYFHPLWLGYGPVYEPTGYFELYGSRLGSTHLGLRIGFGSFPTVGFGFLAHSAPIVHVAPPPPWHYRAYHVGPPHLRHHRHPGLGHGHGRARKHGFIYR